MENHDWAELADLLEGEAETLRPYLDGAAAWLRERTGPVRRVLDVGSGPGVMSVLLAETFPDAEVVAVDGAPELLALAANRAAAAGVRVAVREARLPEEVADLGEADLVWAGQFVHHLGDQQAALDALGALLRPGGVLAVVEGGLPFRCLPRDFGIGRPGLQARLDVVVEEAFTAMRAEQPGSVEVVEAWSAMLGRAGLLDATSRTFLVDRPAPLADPFRAHVRRVLARQAHRAGEVLDAEDTAAVAALLDDDNPAGVRARADLFVLTARTVHAARKPQTGGQQASNWGV